MLVLVFVFVFVGLDFVSGGRAALLMVIAVVGSMAMGMAVSVPMTLRRIGPTFGLERQCVLAHDQVHRAQHIGKHMVGFDLQMVGLELYRHVAVAQVVGGTRQVEWRAMLRAMADIQHGLRRRHNPDQRAVFGHQHIAAAHCGAARQENANTAAAGVDKVPGLGDIPVLGNLFKSRSTGANRAPEGIILFTVSI